MVILYRLLNIFKVILWYKGLEGKISTCGAVFLQALLQTSWRYIEHVALPFNKHFEGIYKTHKTAEESIKLATKVVKNEIENSFNVDNQVE